MIDSVMPAVPAPPSIRIPSYSAPVSRVATPPPNPRKKRQSFSQPVSPVAKKQPASPIAKAKLSPIKSPGRALRKHAYHVTMSKFNPRDHRIEAPCPSHSYTTIEQELAVRPSQSVGGVKWGNTPRALNNHTVECPSHSYATMQQELAVLPSHSVGGVKWGDTPRALNKQNVECPAHSYVSMEQELAVLPSQAVGGVKFGDTPRDVLMPIRPNCPVHVYAEAKSMLSSTGSATFSSDRPRRDAFQQTERALAPVHAYAAPASTLRKAGGVAFGGTTPRADLFASLSRTGLVPASATPRRTTIERPRRATMRSLPKLVPLPEPEMLNLSLKPTEGDGSPREIEAVFA